MARTVGPGGDRRRSRRELLAQGAIAAGALAIGGPVAAATNSRTRGPGIVAGAPRDLISHATFPAGVSAGLPQHDGAPLWTRLEGVERPGHIWLEVARSPDFRQVVDRRAVPVTADTDFTVNHVVDSSQLGPGEELYYRFATRHESSPVGRFRTSIPADSSEPVRVAFFSCQAYQSGYYTAHRGLAQEKDLDLVCAIGDYIYEQAGDKGGPRVDPLPNAQLLSEYRNKYHLYQADASLQAMHAAHPFAAIWDDHEVMSSYYNETPGDWQGAKPRIPFPQRRRNGYRAFFEHLPLIRFPHEPDRIFRRIRLGRHTEIFLTDLHQYALDSSPDCSGTPSIGPILLGPCPNATAPGRALLGPRQRSWLEQGLAGSTATWKLWGSSMMLMALDSANHWTLDIGEWSGWEWERNVLAAYLHKHGVQNIAAFSGDIHTYFAGTWTTTGRSDGAPVGPEFVSGSISSYTIAENFQQNGVPEAAAALLVERLPANNPHLAYVNSTRHGYAVATVTPQELRVDFRSPTTTRQPSAPVETLASFTVEAGDPKLKQVH
ncbi:MAG: alkaline phosphatase D family protein [Actinobacteria bacterium]|nr:alkaline phosphatase D family protein [Actinomycetota bacterium]